MNKGDGNVVLSRIVTRQVSELVEIKIDGGEALTGTPMHPIWSVEHQDWVELGQLEVGDHLLTNAGPVEVLSTRLFTTGESVYNLEVHGHHIYQVTELGILVHNAGISKYDAPKSVTAVGDANVERALANMTADEARRIQNAANRIGQPIHVIGSRAGGPKLPRADSDWDYVIEANSHTRRSAGKSLPGAKDIQEGILANQDIFKSFKKPNQPRITFHPEG